MPTSDVYQSPSVHLNCGGHFQGMPAVVGFKESVKCTSKLNRDDGSLQRPWALSEKVPNPKEDQKQPIDAQY